MKLCYYVVLLLYLHTHSLFVAINWVLRSLRGRCVCTARSFVQLPYGNAAVDVIVIGHYNIIIV